MCGPFCLAEKYSYQYCDTDVNPNAQSYNEEHALKENKSRNTWSINNLLINSQQLFSFIIVSENVLFCKKCEELTGLRFLKVICFFFVFCDISFQYVSPGNFDWH